VTKRNRDTSTKQNRNTRKREHLVERTVVLTHQVLVVVIVSVVNDPVAVLLVEATKPARPEAIAINGRSALETGLAQTLVEALGQRAASDLGMEFASQTAVAVALECCVRAPVREQVRGGRGVRNLIGTSWKFNS
jgi:hypothetical protein